MSKQMTALLKGMGIAMVVGVLAVEGCKMITAMCGKENCRKRRRLKQDANRAMCIMGDLFGDVECLLKK